MKLPPLILASVSPRRSLLLRETGLKFRVIPANADEAHNENLTATELCRINAFRKAHAVAERHPRSLVLGADTLVCLGTRLFGKPRNLAGAKRVLSALQGRTHHVITGVCLLHLATRRFRVFTEQTAVKFKRLDARQIAAYLHGIQPLDKAGAYAIQENGSAIVERIDGSYSNVVGLPVERLRAELARWSKKPRRAVRKT
jgi:septum formation protein